MTIPDPSTDTANEGGEYRYPFLARLYGVDVAAQQIADAIHDLIVAVTDTEALKDALAQLQEADQTIDNIEPGLAEVQDLLKKSHEGEPQ